MTRNTKEEKEDSRIFEYSKFYDLVLYFMFRTSDHDQ